MSTLRTVRSFRSLPSPRSLHTSVTAPKPSHLLSSHQESIRTHFASLTIPILKQECRQRGLKLKGKKTDLVDRIVGFEQAKTYSTASQPQKPAQRSNSTPSKILNSLKGVISSVSKEGEAARKSSSKKKAPESIDAYHVPKLAMVDSGAPRVTKIPIGPDNEGTAVYSDLSVKAVNAGSISSGDVHIVDETSKVSTMSSDLGDLKPNSDTHSIENEQSTTTESDNELKSSDKMFLTVLGGAILSWWWAGKYVSSSDNPKHGNNK